MKWIELLLLPLIAADCACNMLLGGSWRNTLSGEAWHQRAHRVWGWCHKWIDWLFACPAIGQTDHCRLPAEREARHGSVWASWWITFTGGTP